MNTTCWQMPSRVLVVKLMKCNAETEDSWSQRFNSWISRIRFVSGSIQWKFSQNLLIGRMMGRKHSWENTISQCSCEKHKLSLWTAFVHPISHSQFWKLRPIDVLLIADTPKEQCRCVIHENFFFELDARWDLRWQTNQCSGTQG